MVTRAYKTRLYEFHRLDVRRERPGWTSGQVSKEAMRRTAMEMRRWTDEHDARRLMSQVVTDERVTRW